MEPKKLSRMFTETVETDLLALLQAWESSAYYGFATYGLETPTFFLTTIWIITLANSKDKFLQNDRENI
jgi:hypothetical protein